MANSHFAIDEFPTLGGILELSFESQSPNQPHEVPIAEYIERLDEVLPGRKAFLRNIFEKTGLNNFPHKIVAAGWLPIYAGGYWSPVEKILAVNPYFLLFGSEVEIASILIHEGIHSGYFTNGAQVLDESSTQLMTQEKMLELYGTTGMKTGYDHGVTELRELFGEECTLENLIEFTSGTDDETFNKILETILVGSSIRERNIHELNWESIFNNLGKKWDLLCRLFPRLINSIDERNVSLHEDATMTIERFKYKKLEELQKLIANTIVKDSPVLFDAILTSVLWNYHGYILVEDVIEVLDKKGYRYILDFQTEAAMGYITGFVIEHNRRAMGKVVGISRN